LSADGNTAIVGGFYDNSFVGAAWVWTRKNGEWTQQGNKLVGSGAIGTSSQGNSVDLSADGNTAIIGGSLDNGGKGASWVWTRSNGIWTQQGSKLVSSSTSFQGNSVALSADGNTAIVGSSWSAGGKPVAWTRSNGVWSEQGSLLGSGAIGNGQQGFSVDLSADGNTAVVGGIEDNNFSGAIWIWTRSGGVWTQKGNKLVGAGILKANLGNSVSLNAMGNNVIVGGNKYESGTGTAFIFTNIPPTPTISSFSPTSAKTSDTITITGSDLTGTTAITLGGTSVTSFQVLSSSTVTAIVGNGTTGSLSLTTSGGTAALSGFVFIFSAPLINSLSTVTCNGSSFTLSPVNGINGSIPSGTTYSWSAPQLSAGLTGAVSRSNQSAIAGILLNTSNTSLTAVYTVIPTHPINGTGASFTVTVTVHPTAVINSLSTVSCSGVSFSITPTNMISGIIPSGTLYNWTIPQLSTPSLTGGQTGSNRTNITGLFFNNTNTTQTATFIVTPSTPNCGNAVPFSVVVTILPTPQINPISAAVCSGVPFTLTPTNVLNGIIPTATQYSWDVPIYSGSLTGGNSKLNASTISGSLFNNSSTSQTATYFVVPRSGNCVGSTFTVTISINPIPEVNAFSITGCRRISFTALPIDRKSVV
jgi:hypothetical protein